MKRIALAVITTLGLILALLVVAEASANATVPTTITAPDQVGYYANVPITGTAAPGANVAVAAPEHAEPDPALHRTNPDRPDRLAGVRPALLSAGVAGHDPLLRPWHGGVPLLLPVAQ